LIRGTSLPRNPLVSIGRGIAVRGKLVRTGEVLAPVTSTARAGGIRVRAIGGRWSESIGRLVPIASVSGAIVPPASGSAFDGNGMWIWEMSNTEGGNVDRIISRAKGNDVTTLFIKSGDGGGAHRTWAQFSRTLINRLHAAGLRVCAWPYVYGSKPKEEADASIAAIKLGADCLAIDAEVEYEGRYKSAATYISRVRSVVGFGFPISLAGFPYVDYHPSFPYSVFFQTGGAQYNQPQAYWRDIGKPVTTVLSHTWMTNAPYGKLIAPIGQLWQSPKPAEVLLFRQLAAGWGAPGVSWWDWQEAPLKLWAPVGSLIRWPQPVPAPPQWVRLARGTKGDLVLWAQEHLVAAGRPISPDGDFGPMTATAVKAFQTSRSLAANGVIDTPTWKELLRVSLPMPKWMKPAIASASTASIPPAPSQLRRTDQPAGLIVPKTTRLPSKNEFRITRSQR